MLLSLSYLRITTVTTLLSITTLALALPPPAPPLTFLPNLTLPSSLPQQLPTYRSHCVNPRLFRGWSGALDPNDCTRAILSLEGRLPPVLNTQYTFYSRDTLNGATPPHDGWELPVVAGYRTCVLIIQVTRSFDNNTIPFYQQRYLPTSRLPSTVKASWEMVAGAVMAVRRECAKGRRQAGWADVTGAVGRKAAIAIAVSKESELAKKWAGVMVMGEGTVGNGTATA